jgi:hypothetical protein
MLSVSESNSRGLRLQFHSINAANVLIDFGILSLLKVFDNQFLHLCLFWFHGFELPVRLIRFIPHLQT